eukprot:scaffold134570_cov21-Tisochrysis_lutea.AAC.1
MMMMMTMIVVMVMVMMVVMVVMMKGISVSSSSSTSSTRLAQKGHFLQATHAMLLESGKSVLLAFYISTFTKRPYFLNRKLRVCVLQAKASFYSKSCSPDSDKGMINYMTNWK